jgi:hypothetical protein
MGTAVHTYNPWLLRRWRQEDYKSKPAWAKLMRPFENKIETKALKW